MTTKMTPAQFKTTLALSRKAYAAAKASRARDEAYDRENGHRSHYCIHGTNQWTDYDNICGPCEDGVTLLAMTVEHVWQDVKTFADRLAWMNMAPDFIVRGPKTDSLWEWVCAPLNRKVYQ